VLRIGDRVRITVQLVDVANDRSLWAKSYERSLTDIVALQSEVAHAIASEIRIQVTPEERARLRSKGTVNPAAHVAYLQGSFLWNRFTGGSHRSGKRYCHESCSTRRLCSRDWLPTAKAPRIPVFPVMSPKLPKAAKLPARCIAR
jgi:hypothetical protein